VVDQARCPRQGVRLDGTVRVANRNDGAVGLLTNLALPKHLRELGGDRDVG
jgi:hypothetical protein